MDRRFTWSVAQILASPLMCDVKTTESRTLFMRAVIVLAVLIGSHAEARAADGPGSPAFFEHYIRPVLETKCLKCHAAKKQEGNLRLDSFTAMAKGGESGPAIVKGKPADSLLLEAIRYDGLEMPPTGQLPSETIKQFEAWIAAGAIWPDHAATLREATGAITDDDRNWWAYRPLTQPKVPLVDGDDWSRNEIDRFVYQKLDEKDLRPAPAAGKAKLVRRLYFDLIGLPPTPEDIDAFVNDSSPNAFAELVDRLLDDKRYGEHWARHWLDIVRYADSDGWNQDAVRPHIWRYRDYVVNSFNDDKPYPQFVREQLAGDEIGEDNPDHLVATGYLRLGIYEYNQRDARGLWNDIMNETTDVTSDVFLGTGLACARCHDHKFDPLPQKDYFALRAFFEPIEWRDDIQYATQKQLDDYTAANAKWKKASADVQKKIDALLKPYHDKKWKSTADKFPLDIQACFYKPVEERTSWEHQMAYLVSRQFEEEGGGPLKSMSKSDKTKYEALKKELQTIRKNGTTNKYWAPPKRPPLLMTASDFHGAASPTTIPEDRQKTPVEPDLLTVLDHWNPQLPKLKTEHTTGRRSRLAAWIGHPKNPLTNRVIVNRIWQQHFGTGITESSNDFGHLGQQPTHPKLLDWLATTFVADGFSMKRLHRRILLSSTWQQSSHHPLADDYQLIDPNEKLLWRSSIRRLNAEQIRDSMLAVSGELIEKHGGPTVSSASRARTIYVKRMRNTPDTFLHVFDAANGLNSVAVRNTTTTPIQSLAMINGKITLARANTMAARLTNRNHSTPDELIDYAVQLTWGRRPTSQEFESALEFIVKDSKIDNAKLIDFCHVLLNSNEFLYID